MSPLARILAALLSAALAFGVAFLMWTQRGDGDTVGLVNNTVRAQELLESREESRVASGHGTTKIAAPSLEERSRVTAEEAGTIFMIPEHTFEPDPHTYYRYKANLNQERRWSEHPKGRWYLQTNANGLRELDEPDLGSVDEFILVAGDSHVDGMCNIDENFCQLVESGLRKAAPDKKIEVLNTGTSGFTFFNYLGALDKYLEFGPEKFVVTVYGGNDYLGNVMPQHFFSGTAPPPRFESYWKKLAEASDASSAAVGMALNQAYYFQHYPDEVEVALQSALALTAEIQAVCEQNDIELIWIYIPPLYDVDAKRTEEMEEARKILELTDYDMSISGRITDSVLSQARKQGNNVIDLRDEFAPSEGPFYWLDGHINVKAHALIAERLLLLL